MGKDWDGDKGGRNQWVKWATEVFAECLRVMKPGAHGLVWALPRTSHWTATALENAGFEVRDVVLHCFGTGFPKSLDVSKAIDKAAGAERETIEVGSDGARRKPRAMAPGGAERVAVQTVSAPATDDAKRWSGFGTALKPAAENWILVRKPLSEKTVAKNVLRWGTGALNIDGARVGSERPPTTAKDFAAWRRAEGRDDTQEVSPDVRVNIGRFPSHLLFSHSPECREKCAEGCAVKELDRQSGTLKSPKPYQRSAKRSANLFEGGVADGDGGKNFGDNGGASRFFYCAKASRADRNSGLEGMPERVLATSTGQTRPNKPARLGADPYAVQAPVANHHPTVKSTQLMRYLCKLVTPPGGRILDPFAGSGSTGVAALREGFEFTGIEQNPVYAEIARSRIDEAK